MKIKNNKKNTIIIVNVRLFEDIQTNTKNFYINFFFIL
jgi:hypothetical protein